MMAHPRRIHTWNEIPDTGRPVVYSMSRNQRVAGMWILLHAQEHALETARAAGGTVSGDAFLKELIIRRGGDFCWYNMHYDRA